MKKVNKIIICSCVFCYSIGLIIILISSRIHNLPAINYAIHFFCDLLKIPFDENFFWQISIIYTILFAIITFIIYKNITKQGERQEIEQLNAKNAFIYSAQIQHIINSHLSNVQIEHDNAVIIKQKSDILSKKIKSLSANTIENKDTYQDINALILSIHEACDNNDVILLLSTLNEAISEIDLLKQKESYKS